MPETEQTGPSDETHVGTRYRSEVEAAHRKLEAKAAEPGRRPPFDLGLLAGYGWALGLSGRSPVTGRASTGAPDVGLLTAEVDAATVQLESAAQDGVPQDHVQGVFDALAWICGQLDQRP